MYFGSITLEVRQMVFYGLVRICLEHPFSNPWLREVSIDLISVYNDTQIVSSQWYSMALLACFMHRKIKKEKNILRS
ncbi:uncharacterized protein MYCFIDRAFT_174212 [Pseudocercospora fijiensis CIRAD86]|uniref:Uncharacterized protein n=1 Tax=Pseudocercospora fijiensis (strain CIRAD86) TaxID=383855 RepID=M2YYC2_PSEFD|nr:uncharacterized protein MYCFIDRAFT_174212 [Pseudocercospora fijiensis CIRAD86]EME82645.1 hypothetical protein MYCFIDRAFT_174212 [Pseudocercospora fijiensis CIRAD86]